jgi:hypothetical protein
MTNIATALCPVSAPELEALRPLLAAATRPLRLAPGGPALAPDPPPTGLRNPDLVADLRRARAARFGNRYEWLALRRRRAQTAARRALEPQADRRPRGPVRATLIA